MTARNTAYQTRRTQAFIEDYNDLRSWGHTDRHIADHMGIELDSLRTRLRRNGITPNYTQRTELANA